MYSVLVFWMAICVPSCIGYFNMFTYRMVKLYLNIPMQGVLCQGKGCHMLALNKLDP